MLRALDIGQYNLEISNAELSDDSLYECQATEAALRSRRAKLNVLSKWTTAADTGAIFQILFLWFSVNQHRLSKGPFLSEDTWGDYHIEECQVDTCVLVERRFPELRAFYTQKHLHSLRSTEWLKSHDWFRCTAVHFQTLFSRFYTTDYIWHVILVFPVKSPSWLLVKSTSRIHELCFSSFLKFETGEGFI